MKIDLLNDIPFGSNIQDVIVPEILKKRIPSGIEYFDHAVGGLGFTPTVVTLFTGQSGAGKTTATLALANALARDSNVIYNTAEESLYQLKTTVERLRLKENFKVGSLTNVDKLLSKTEMIREKDKRQTFLFIDSLQCIDDGHFSTGRITSATAERSLAQIISYTKESGICTVVVGQVNKDGKMAGSNRLKHMVDAHIHMYIEEKDPDTKGCRVMETEKNRFGGAGYISWLEMKQSGLHMIAKYDRG